MAEFQKPPNYMNKEGETCFVKKGKDLFNDTNYNISWVFS